MTHIPDEDSQEYDSFFQEELRKITYGVTINGVYIHGWLYWYWNHWHIYFDDEDEINKDIIRVFKTPQCRDNEWMIAEYLKQAEEQKKGLLIFGSRQIGKTMFEASWIGRGATIYEGSQNVVASTNTDDLGILTSAIDKGTGAVHPYFRFERLKYNWAKEVSLGIETKQGKKYEFSKILIRNLDEGRNTEAIAGTTPKTLVIDEIGKVQKILEAFAAAKPGFTSRFGWRCVPILTGCVCAGTKVWDNKGKLTNIEDLKPEKGILGFDINNKEISKEDISYWQSPHEKKCYRITTNLGRTLECSNDHPILFRSRDEKTGHRNNRIRKIYFKKAEDLKPKEQIAVIDSVPFFGYKNMWKPRIVGMLIGDGSYGFDKTPVFSNCDEELNNLIDNELDTKIEKSYLTKEGKLYRETRIKNICSELRKLGIYGQTKEKKTLPYKIDSYNKHSLLELLGGLFDTDGCVCDAKVGIIKLTAAHKSILEEVKFLLIKFGIHSSISFKKPNLKNPKDKNGYFDLLISDRKSILNFRDNINLKIGHKRYNLFSICEKLKFKKNRIPREINNLRFESIKTIEYIGIKPVYNLTAGTTNTYIANGIITHNTGGSFINNSDAEKMFNEPEANNFLAVEWPNRTKKYGIFVPRKYRLEGKVHTHLGDFLQTEKGILIPDHSELYDLDFYTSNEAKANEKTQEEIKQAELSRDPKAALKAIMYYPQNPEDCFLSDETNPFPVEAIQQHLLYLDTIEKTGESVELYRDKENKVHFTFNTKLKEITDFPVTATTIKEAPIIMYEPPCNDRPPHLLYIAGSDPYNQNTSNISPSLGTVHIYKRMYDPVNGTFQNMIVASYAGRPKEMREWHKIVEMFLDLYNATCMPENEGTNFIEYMGNKNKSYMLADGYNLLKDISPNTSILNRPKGLPATIQVINHCMALLIDYCWEELKLLDENGNVISTKLGVTRIRDRMLLKEMLNWHPKTNCDRIVSFRHALAYDSYLQKISPLVKYEEDLVDMTPKKRPVHSPFKVRKSTMGIRGKKLTV